MIKYNSTFYILILTFSLLSLNLLGQKSEFRYFSFKIHFIHNFHHPQASNPIERFYIAPNNDTYQLYADQEYLLNYKLTMGASFLYHFDFENLKMGITSGINFQNKNYSCQYKTDYNSEFLKENYKLLSIGVPIYIKFGKDIYKHLQYFYSGVQVDFNLKVVNYNSYMTNSNYTLSSEEYNLNNISFIFGFNRCAFNFEIEIQPFTNLNKTYTFNSLSPYSSQKGGFIFLKTNLNLNGGLGILYSKRPNIFRSIIDLFLCW